MPVSPFIISFLGAYLTLYAFYTPIAHGPRLPLSLFLPSMFCMIYLSSRFQIREKLLYRKGSILVRPRTWHHGMLAVLGIVIVSLYPYWILNKYTGG